MNFQTQLAEIKELGAGVYMATSDAATQLPPVASISRYRIIPINVKSGNVNSVVMFQQRDFQGFKNVFGDITRKDERNGNFSVRSCLQALENGPILVINLRNFTDADVAGYKALTTMLTSDLGQQNSPAAGEVAFTSLYSTDRLWSPKPDSLLSNTDANLFNIANIGTKNISVYVRKSANAGYRQTIAQYYASQNRPVPEYLNPNELFINTMVEVFVFNTDLSDLAKNKSNEHYGQFFGDKGLVQSYNTGTGDFDALQLLTTVSEAGFVQKFEGSLVPGALDASGKPFYIEEVVNAASLVTGLVLKVDDEKLEDYSDFEPVLDEDDKPVYAGGASKRTYPIDLVGQNLFAIDNQGNVDETKLTPTINTLSYVGHTLTKGEVTELPGGDYNTTQLGADVVEVPVYGVLGTALTDGDSTVIIPDAVNIAIGDHYIGVSGNLVRAYDKQPFASKKVIAGLGTPGVAVQANGTEFPKNPQGQYIYPVGGAKAGQLVSFDSSGLPEDADGDVIPVPALSDSQFATLFAKYGKTINYVKVKFDGFVENGYNLPAGAQIEATGNDGSDVTLVTSRAFLVHAVTDSAQLSAVKLKAYRVRNDQFTNGSNENQKSVLSVLNQPGIIKGMKGIQEQGVMKFRYVVDAFKTFIEPNAKSEFMNFAEETKSFALVNSPFLKDFAASTNPYFRATPQSPFEIRFIPLGGNRDITSNNTFSLPRGKGSDRIWFFGFGLKSNYFGTPLIVPPAAAASKAFLNKFSGGNAYDTVANRSGLFSVDAVSDVEEPLDEKERGLLEKMGINPIINDTAVGLMIYGDETAKKDVKSDLGKIHIAELVLYIQEEYQAILREYPFKSNNEVNRIRLKTQADKIMTRIQSNGGVVWFLNVCDASNNTQDIINDDMGILELHIQAVKNGEKWFLAMNLHNGVPTFEVSGV